MVYLTSLCAFQGQHLTQKDTILVTAQYRLGSLGYFSSAERDASGNAGLFDLRAVMAWVRISAVYILVYLLTLYSMSNH